MGVGAVTVGRELAAPVVVAAGIGFALLAWAPYWMIFPTAGAGVCFWVVIFVECRSKRAHENRALAADEAARAARMEAGTPSGRDVERAIYYRWGLGEDQWTEENGLVPFSHGQVVRFAVREPNQWEPENGTHDPAVIMRWVVSGEHPATLVQFIRAGITSTELVTYMDGDAGVRDGIASTASLVTALNPDC